MGLLKCLLEGRNSKPSNLFGKSRAKQSRVMALKVCIVNARSTERPCKLALLKKNEFLIISSMYNSMTQLLLHTFTHLIGPSSRVKAKLLPNKIFLGLV